MRNWEPERQTGGLLDINGASKYIACSKWTIRKKVYSGEIVGVKGGTKLCVERAELERYIREHRTNRGREQ